LLFRGVCICAEFRQASSLFVPLNKCLRQSFLSLAAPHCQNITAAVNGGCGITWWLGRHTYMTFRLLHLNRFQYNHLLQHTPPFCFSMSTANISPQSCAIPPSLVASQPIVATIISFKPFQLVCKRWSLSFRFANRKRGGGPILVPLRVPLLGPNYPLTYMKSKMCTYLSLIQSGSKTRNHRRYFHAVIWIGV
jgi:hypothetical protein